MGGDKTIYRATFIRHKKPRHCAGFFMLADCTSWSKFATHYYAAGVSFGREGDPYQSLMSVRLVN